MKLRLGFSMVEIVVSLVILAVGFLPIYNLFRQGSATATNNIQETEATNYASDIINFCKDLKYYQIDNADHSDEINLASDEDIHNFFRGMNPPIEPPPEVGSPYKRSLFIKKFDKRSIGEIFSDWRHSRQKVRSYKVRVTVTFPRMQGKANETDPNKLDSVILYTMIMD